MRGVRRRNRKSSDLRLDTNNVRFIFPPAETVLSVGHRLDGAGDGVLVRLCRQSHRVVCARRCRRGDILVGTVALVRPLFRPLRRNLRPRLDGVRAASLGAVVRPRFRADPVHILFSGPGQRRHQQLVRAVLRSRPGRAFEIEAGHGRAVYTELSTFAGIALVAVVVGVMTRFFVSHYIFRWRTAMNDFYMVNWPRLRTIEGASQRVQEDTMRFSTTVEGLGVNLISAVLTLLAFLPVLAKLSSNITDLPLIGSIPYPLVFAAVIWSVIGTGALALIGIRLPRIEFFNQRVEAAYRKELVLGEDDPTRADPPTVRELFSDIRCNYFRLYLNFMYFNIGRFVYLQADVVFPYALLAPTIVSGRITLGAMNQILNAFSQVRTSFQYLVNSWSTIVELISIYQRLRAFEAKIDGEPLPSIEVRAEPVSS